MSQDFMDAELFADFIIEAKEHLETIEPNLLELEKAPDNLSLLNDIFRPMHSMKGASGFMGLNRINQLAHRAENILDELRKGDMVVTSEIMDVILSATDALRQMIDNLEQTNTEGDVAIEPIIEQIDAIMAGDMPAAAPAAPAAPVAPASVEPSAGAAEAPAQPDPVADPVPGADEDDDEGISPQEWIDTLPSVPGYALTAFGEGHLKDFMDEAREITENLNSGLLDLERNPDGSSELVNDLFRFFHNLKGNSGIIGFQELNGLTHEAETLLNRVRHGEMPATHELIDLLLLVTDVMDALVDTIEPSSGQVTPFDTSSLLTQLQQAVAGGTIELPEALRAGKSQPVAAPAPVEDIAPPAVHAVGVGDDDDLAVFSSTVRQQAEIIRVALAELGRDSSQKEYIDALYRALVAIQNASKFMGFKELRVYAERTAGLVDQARNSDMDFGLMVDLLSQETGIINDMTEAVLAAPPASGPAAETGNAPEDKAASPAPATVAKPEAKAAAPAQPEPKASAAP